MLRLRRRCGSSSPPRSTAFADLDAPDDASSCSTAAPDPGPGRAAVHSRRSPRPCGGTGAATSRPAPSRSRPCCAPRRCANRPRCRPPSPRSSPARSASSTALNAQIAGLGEVVAEHFGRHPDAEIYTSQPGLGVILGARVLGRVRRRPAPLSPTPKPARTTPAPHRSPAPRARKNVVLARYARNTPPRRRAAAMGLLLAARLTRRPRLLRHPARARKIGHQAALRQLGQPTRRHPARLPQDPHPLRRDHRLGTPPHRHRRLTSKNLGCLSRLSSLALR